MIRLLLILVWCGVVWISQANARSGTPGNNPTLNPAGISPCIIDTLSVHPSAAYALRRLSCTYTGHALTVTRSSTNTSINIDFVGPAINTSALITFCSGTVCNISEWFDQSGNSRNLICFGGNAINCPLIFSASTFAATIGPNTKPAALINSTYPNPLYGNTSADTGIVGTTAGGIFAVANAASGHSGSSTASWWEVGSVVEIRTSDANGNTASLGFIQGGSLYSPPSLLGERYLGTWLGSPTDMYSPITYTYGTDGIFGMRWNTSDTAPTKFYLNGGTPATNSSTAANNASTEICLPSGAATCLSVSTLWSGNLTEAYTFDSEPTIADVNALGANIHAWFGLTWTNITQ
jgi:Alpha-L-arabinofuranosidase B, catalytic